MIIGAGALALLGCAFAFTIGTGSTGLTLALAGFALALLAILLALRMPYLFPYGLYIVLVPFDNMLKIGGGAGTVTKLLGIASTFFVVVYAMRRKGLNRPPLSLYFWLAYLCWTLISMMWSPNLSEGMTNSAQTLSLIGMFAVLAVAPVGERDVRAICACIVFGGIASSIYGMYLLHQAPQLTEGDLGRLMINVDNRTIDANHFANAMLTPIALCLVTLLNARKPAVILGTIAALAILVAGVVMSLSREALLAVIIVVAVLIAFSKRRVLGAMIGIPLVVLAPILIPAIGKRMSDAAATGGAGRTSVWRVAWVAFQQHPVFGWGSGGFGDSYDKYYLSVYQFYNAGWGRASHNTLIHAAVELGVVGLVLLCTAYALTLPQLANIHRGDSMFDLRIAFTASIIALGFIAFFIDVANYKYMWVVLAAAAQIRSVSRSYSAQARWRPVAPVPSRAPVRTRAAPSVP